MARVLVTGGTGFVGAHCIIQLLAAGHETRTTVRNLVREDDVRAMLRQGGAGNAGERLAFYAADLTNDAGWAEAVDGCDFVLHVASPFPDTATKDEEGLIAIARDGVLRVLRAARNAGVKRVVLTSSFGAVGYGHDERTSTFTEEDWTDIANKNVRAYQKSKTVAERAAWDFIANEGHGLQLSVVNPVGIMGPVLGEDYSTSILLVKRMLDGSIPGCPDLWVGAVDVRDVASLHLKAMTNPAANGERYLATAGEFVNMRDVALILRNEFGTAASKVPLRTLPNWLVRVIGLFDAQVSAAVPELGRRRQVSNEKARIQLGWEPRAPKESIIATARSLIELGLLTA